MADKPSLSAYGCVCVCVSRIRTKSRQYWFNLCLIGLQKVYGTSNFCFCFFLNRFWGIWVFCFQEYFYSREETTDWMRRVWPYAWHYVRIFEFSEWTRRLVVISVFHSFPTGERVNELNGFTFVFMCMEYIIRHAVVIH